MSPALRALAGDEMRRWFRSPLAWVVLALGSGAMALVFVLLVMRYLDQQALLSRAGVTAEVLAHYFMSANLSMLIAMPLLTMNLVAGDRADGQLRFLFSQPLGAADIVVSKLVGAGCLLLAYLALLVAMPLTLAWGTPVDFGVWASNALGLFLFTLFHLALGLAVSAGVRSALIAALLTLGLSLGAWYLDWAARLDPEQLVVGGWSTLSRLRGFNLGLISTADAAFFVIGAACFVLIAIALVALEREAT